VKITFRDKINKFRADLTDHLNSNPGTGWQEGDEITLIVRSKRAEDGTWQEYQTQDELEFERWQLNDEALPD